MSTVIYLLRHAAYENPKQIFHGRLPGFPLSAEGIRQTQRLASFFRNKPINAIYSSLLIRAYQTALMIARPHGLDAETDDRLMDIKTPLQGKPISYLESINWNFYRPEYIAQGGETLRTVFQRMDACIREKVAVHRGQHIIFVSHGDPIMAIKIKYLGGHLRSRKLMNPYVATASGYTITIDSEMVITSVSDFP